MKKMMKFAAMAVAAIALCVACEPENEVVDMTLDGKQFTCKIALAPDYLVDAVVDLGATAAGQMYIGTEAVASMGGDPENLASGIVPGDYISMLPMEVKYTLVPNEDGKSGKIMGIPHVAGEEPAEGEEPVEFGYSDWNGKTIVFDFSYLDLAPLKAKVSTKTLKVHPMQIGW